MVNPIAVGLNKGHKTNVIAGVSKNRPSRRKGVRGARFPGVLVYFKMLDARLCRRNVFSDAGLLPADLGRRGGRLLATNGAPGPAMGSGGKVAAETFFLFARNYCAFPPWSLHPVPRAPWCRVMGTALVPGGKPGLDRPVGRLGPGI